MSTVMCRTKFYARAFLLTSYRAHQRRFDICVALKRVAQGRLHQHCRGLSEQHRTTRSGLQMQACKAYFRTFVLLAPSIFWPNVHKWVFGFTMLLVASFRSDAFFEQLFRTAGWNTFQNQKMQPATHSTATRLFCSGRSKMWSHTADSTMTRTLNPAVSRLKSFSGGFSFRKIARSRQRMKLHTIP